MTKERPLVLTVAAMADELDTSKRTIHRLNSSGLLPRPLRLGGQPRWSREEVNAWLEAGMPDRKSWEVFREGHVANKTS